MGTGPRAEGWGLQPTKLAMSFCVSPKPASLRTCSGSMFFLGLPIAQSFLDLSPKNELRCLPQQVRRPAVACGVPCDRCLSKDQVLPYSQNAPQFAMGSQKPAKFRATTCPATR